MSVIRPAGSGQVPDKLLEGGDRLPIGLLVLLRDHDPQRGQLRDAGPVFVDLFEEMFIFRLG